MVASRDQDIPRDMRKTYRRFVRWGDRGHPPMSAAVAMGDRGYRNSSLPLWDRIAVSH